MGTWWFFQNFSWFCATDLLVHILCPFYFERCVKTKALGDMAADLAGNDSWNSHWCTSEGKQGLARKLELFLLGLYSPQSTKQFFPYVFNYKLRSN